MAPILSICGCAVLSVVLVYKYIITPLFLSPLSKLPTAHPLCAITSRWHSYQIKKQRELKVLYAAHQKHGPIIRIGPNEVSVVSREGLRQIYTAGLEKTLFYTQFQNFGFPNMFSMPDHRSHSVQKRMITNLFANSNIQHSRDVDELSRKVILERFLPMLQQYARTKEDVDVLKLFQWTGADFIAAFAFGTSNYVDFLGNKPIRDLYFTEWDRIRDEGGTGRMDALEDVVMKMCERALSEKAQIETGTGTKAIAFDRLYSQLGATDAGLSQSDLMKRVASEMQDHLIASHETTGTTLTYAAYHLSLDPALQAALRSELLTLQPIVAESTERTLPSPASIDRLPLLDAIVKETLRLHAAAPGRQPRVTPAGGMNLHGFYIPAGTMVSSNAYCLHRNDRVFPDPFKFLPYRWTPTNDGSEAEKNPRVEEMNRWFWAFGSGGRMCVGSNLALQLLKLVIAAVYTNFETIVIDDKGIEQKDSYLAPPVGNKLILQFRPAVAVTK